MSRQFYLRKTERPCRECGVYFDFGNTWQNVCEYCAKRYKEKYMLTIDVGTYHAEVNTALMSPKQISKIIAKSCSYAKQLKKNNK